MTKYNTLPYCLILLFSFSKTFILQATPQQSDATSQLCDFEDPLVDLPWLTEMITTSSECMASISQSNWHGNTVFLFHYESVCELEDGTFIIGEIEFIVYDCTGQEICTYGFLEESCDTIPASGKEIWPIPEPIDCTNSPILTLVAFTSSDCNNEGGAIDISAVSNLDNQPNLFYLWNTGAITEDLHNIAAGDYALTITNEHGCSTTVGFTVFQVDMEDCLAEDDHDIFVTTAPSYPPSKPSIKLYPNPTSNISYIKFAKPLQETTQLVLSNSLGIALAFFTLPAESTTYTIQLEPYPLGIYFLNLEGHEVLSLIKSSSL